MVNIKGLGVIENVNNLKSLEDAEGSSLKSFPSETSMMLKR